jgi:hypothetical protein
MPARKTCAGLIPLHYPRGGHVAIRRRSCTGTPRPTASGGPSFGRLRLSKTRSAGVRTGIRPSPICGLGGRLAPARMVGGAFQVTDAGLPRGVASLWGNGMRCAAVLWPLWPAGPNSSRARIGARIVVCSTGDSVFVRETLMATGCRNSDAPYRGAARPMSGMGREGACVGLAVQGSTNLRSEPCGFEL